MSGYNTSTLAQLRSASTPAMKQAYALRLKEAAEVIAVRAREISATFSKRIPASVKVRGGVGRIWIEAGGDEAPNAYPIEEGAYHPVWATGPRNTWRWSKKPMTKRPFLEQAGETAIDQAAEAFSKVFDDWCNELDL